jgi:hypothetical protein
MSKYTIVVSYSGVAVFDGILPKSRRKFWADGLQINIKGVVSVPMRDKVLYHAYSLCRAHHIPISRLYAEGWI